MQADNVIFPFLTPRPIETEDGYFKTIKSRFFPHFQPASISTVIILLNVLIFIIMHIAFDPSNYSRFLEWPSEMNKWWLDIGLVKSNKAYMYQAFTAMFLHQNYLHILGNTLFSIFIMYEMEYSWRWSIPMGILAGFTANCLAILFLEGRLLGFSGVLTSYIGMIVALLVSHLQYFQSRSQGTFCIFIVFIVLLAFGAIGFGSSVLIHLFGFVMGFILALAFYPKHP